MKLRLINAEGLKKLAALSLTAALGVSGTVGCGGDDEGSGGSGGGKGGTGGSGGTGGTGTIACGNASCSVPGSKCCAGSPATGCQSTSADCPDVEIRCDGPEDCSGGQICCADFFVGKLDDTSCRSPGQCDKDEIVCGNSPSACSSGYSCKPISGFPQYLVCQ